MRKPGGRRLTGTLICPYQTLDIRGRGAVVAFLFENQALDASRRELRRDGKAVPMPPQVFDLLLFLVENRDRVVSKDDILDAVWEGRAVSDSALTTRINAVRRAVGDSGEEQRLVRTMPRKGFRFVGEVRHEAPQKAPRDDGAIATPSVAPLEDNAGHRPALVVLPFTNMGGDPEQDYFADGITEDIITALSRWRSFGVIARNSAFTYKGRAVDVKQVGRELGVAYVLEGSVRRAGNRIRITAQLIETATAAHVWAERYDRELADVFEVQDGISRAIASVIEPVVGRHERLRSGNKPPASLEAWDCLNHGLYLLYKFNPTDNLAARTWFERAIALDPDLSRAHTSLAYTYQREIVQGTAADRDHAIRQQIAHARRGAELDEGDSYPHLILAFGYRWARRHDLCLAEAHKASASNPYDGWALAMLGLALDISGQHREGAETMERANTLNPREPHAKWYPYLIGRAYLSARDLPAAELWARRSVDADAGYVNGYLLLACILGHQGRKKDAADTLAAAERLHPGYAVYWLSLREYRDDEDNERLAEGLAKAGFKK
jgi:TolB-like protein